MLFTCMLPVACKPQEVRGAVASDKAAYLFWGVGHGAGYEPLKEAPVVAEIRLEGEELCVDSSGYGKAEVKYRGVVSRCLRGPLEPGTRVLVNMVADDTPYAVVNQCIADNVPCRFSVDHGARRAYLYVADERGLSVLPENAVHYDADPSLTPIFWGSEADAAISALFPENRQ